MVEGGVWKRLLGGREEGEAKDGLEEEVGGVGVGGDGGGIEGRWRVEGEIVGRDVAEARERQIERIIGRGGFAWFLYFMSKYYFLWWSRNRRNRQQSG